MKEFQVQYKWSFYFGIAFFVCLSIIFSAISFMAKVYMLFLLNILIFWGFVIYQVILMQKIIIFDSERIVVKRYFLRDFSIYESSVLSFGSQAIKTYNGSIPLGCIKNARIILEHFIEFIDIKSKDELFSLVNENRPFVIFLNENELKKRTKEMQWGYWFGLIFNVVGFSTLIIILFVDNAPIIILVGILIFMASFLITSRFEKHKKNMKIIMFNKLLLPMVSLLVALALTFLLYTVFIYFGIDLLKQRL